MINILINILLACIVGLPSGNMTENHLSEERSAQVSIAPLGENSHSSSYPDSQSHLFAIHQPAESGVEWSSKTAQQLYSTTERDNGNQGNTSSESHTRRQISITVYEASRIEPGLSVRSLIFPFHFFL